MASFYNAERIEAGWRFFVLWFIMTLLGLGIGAAIEFFIFKQINGNIAVLFAAITQAWTLNRHVSIYIPWSVVNALAWWIASLIGWAIFSVIAVPNPYIALAAVAVIAGLLASGLEFFFLKEWLPIGIWWIAVSALSWLSFGIVPAIILTVILTKDTIPMEGRWFEASSESPA